MLVGAIDWTSVIIAFIAGVPAIIGAIYSARIHGQIKTPSGKTLGDVAEYAHDTVIANNLLLSKSNGPTKHADAATLSASSKTPPMIPDPPQPTAIEA